MESNGRNRRSFFRLIFPAGEQAILKTAAGKFPIIELSEGGARVEAFSFVTRKGFYESATVTFTSGVSIPACATLLRDMPSVKIIGFSPNIPLAEMINEQRRLIATYGKQILVDGESPARR